MTRPITIDSLNSRCNTLQEVQEDVSRRLHNTEQELTIVADKLIELRDLLHGMAEVDPEWAKKVIAVRTLRKVTT